MALTISDVSRFLCKVDRSGGMDACWLWTAGKGRKGYGRFKLAGKTLKAHRIAYELANDVSPVDLCVCHKCDRPSCCNPSHLCLGTNQDNMDDMVAKSRQAVGDAHGSRLHPERWSRGDAHYSRVNPDVLARGEANGWAKLTSASIPEIRSRAAVGESQRSIARSFCVSRTAIRDVLSGKNWRHI